MTYNRIAIAAVLIYFPVAVFGRTGSYSQAFSEALLIVLSMVLGALEYADYMKKEADRG